MTYYPVSTERRTTSNEYEKALATVTHVREDSIRDIQDANKISLHHTHHPLDPVNPSVLPPCDNLD